MSSIVWPQKHPDSINESFFVVWCSKDGTNDGGANDSGELQGRTLSSVLWTVPTGITKISQNTDAVTIKNVSYPADTVAAIVLSGGTDRQNYEFTCHPTFSDGEDPAKNIELPVREDG